MLDYSKMKWYTWLLLSSLSTDILLTNYFFVWVSQKFLVEVDLGRTGVTSYSTLKASSSWSCLFLNWVESYQTCLVLVVLKPTKYWPLKREGWPSKCLQSAMGPLPRPPPPPIWVRLLWMECNVSFQLGVFKWSLNWKEFLVLQPNLVLTARICNAAEILYHYTN